MSYILGQVAALAVVAAAVWIMGCALEQIVSGRATLGPWQPLSRLVLGVGGWVVATFVLATLGLLRLEPILALLVITFFGGTWGWWSARGERTRPQGLRSRWPSLGNIVALVIVAALVTPAFLLLIGPTVSWDADVYHLTLPRLYLEHGGFTDQSLLVYDHWPQAIELLFAAAMILGSFVTAKLVHLFFGLIVLWAVARAAGRAAGAAAGWLAVALVLVNDVVFFELRSAYVDLAYAFFLLAAVILLNRAIDGTPQNHGRPAPSAFDTNLFLAGISGGLMAGVKVTGIIGAVAAAVVYLPALRRGGLPAVRRFGVSYIAPVLILWLPWLIKAMVETGNPIYPLAWQWWGGDHWSAALSEQFSAWQQSIGMGRTPMDYLLLPYRVITEGGRGYAHFDGRISTVWLLLLPLSLFAVRRRPLVRHSLAVAGVYFVAWAFSSQQMRFLIPIVPLLALAAAISIADLFTRIRQPLRPILGATAVAAVLLLAATTHARVLVAGYERLGLYQQTNAATLRAAAVPEVFRWIDEHLPEQAKILMLNTNAGFFCPRRYAADSFFEASQIADWLGDVERPSDLRLRLHQAGFDHVLWSGKDWGIAWPAALRELLGDPALAEPLFQDDRGHMVLRLQ